MTRINSQQIPQSQLDTLSRTLLAALDRFYAEPGNIDRFNAWMQSEEGASYVQRNTAT